MFQAITHCLLGSNHPKRDARIARRLTNLDDDYANQITQIVKPPSKKLIARWGSE